MQESRKIPNTPHPLPRAGIEHKGRGELSIVFTKGGGAWLENIADIGCNAIGLDWTVDIAAAKTRVGHRVALQGNLDPAALYASPEKLREEVKFIINAYGQESGHIFNLGHGVEPDVAPENVAVLVDAVHELSRI